MKNNRVWLAIVCAVVVWFIGGIADANPHFGEPEGYLMLRVLLPVLVMGGFILAGQENDRQRADDEDRDHK